MRTRAVPFPEAPVEAVDFAAPWQMRIPSGDVPLPDDVPAWDFQAVLHLTALLTVDVAAVRAACRLGDRTTLLVVVTAGSSTTKMRGPVVRRAVDDTTGPIPLDIRLVGHELGGRLVLDTLLVATTVERVDALSPTAEASILWRHRRTAWLEGEGSRFPTEVVDLSRAPFFSPGALWFLDGAFDDLEATALGAFRLVLNETHPTVVRMLSGDSSPETTAALSALHWDVARHLVVRALERDEFVEREGMFEEDTLGALLARVVTLFWPGESPGALRRLRVDDPARFEREMQDRVGLFRA